jgi:transketolase
MPTMRDRFASVTTELLAENPRSALVLADISADRFASAARDHPNRVINVGIREQLAVGAAAGLALTGFQPIVHTYASFLVERPFEQIKLDFGHQGVGAVLVSVGASYDWAAGGRTHHAPGDVALLDTLPGWTVHVPGHPAEVEPLLRQSLEGTEPAYIRLSDRTNALPRSISTSRFEVVDVGSRGTVVAVGPLLDAVLAAVEGLDMTVLYAATVRPFDSDTLVRTLRTPAVVLVEPYLAGTSVQHASAALAHVPHRLLGLGVPRGVELRRYGRPEQHDRAYGLDARALRHAISTFLDGLVAPLP